MIDFKVTRNKHRLMIAWFSLISAVTLAFTACFIQPQGEIHSSILIMTSQLLILVATCVGLDLSFGHYGNTNSHAQVHNNGQDSSDNNSES